MSDEEIVNEISKFDCNFVVLTGGEPALYVDKAFLDLLHKAGKYVCIETNGTRLLPDNVDWVTLSPKEDFCPNAEVVLKKADEVKVVFTGVGVDKYVIFPAKYHYLQPCDFGDADKNSKNVQACIAYCLSHPVWALSMQMQKLLSFK